MNLCLLYKLHYHFQASYSLNCLVSTHQSQLSRQPSCTILSKWKGKISTIIKQCRKSSGQIQIGAPAFGINQNHTSIKMTRWHKYYINTFTTLEFYFYWMHNLLCEWYNPCFSVQHCHVLGVWYYSIAFWALGEPPSQGLFLSFIMDWKNKRLTHQLDSDKLHVAWQYTVGICPRYQDTENDSWFNSLDSNYKFRFSRNKPCMIYTLTCLSCA